MNDADVIDPDVIDLVVQLCTRIGMIMENATPVALDASREGLEERIAALAVATRTMATIAAAAEGLLQ